MGGSSVVRGRAAGEPARGSVALRCGVGVTHDRSVSDALMHDSSRRLHDTPTHLPALGRCLLVVLPLLRFVGRIRRQCLMAAVTAQSVWGLLLHLPAAALCLADPRLGRSRYCCCCCFWHHCCCCCFWHHCCCCCCLLLLCCAYRGEANLGDRSNGWMDKGNGSMGSAADRRLQIAFDWYVRRHQSINQSLPKKQNIDRSIDPQNTIVHLLPPHLE